MIKKSIFEQNAELYVEKVIMINESVKIVDQPKYDYLDGESKIVLNISGEYVSEKRINDWERQLINYDLQGVKLKVNNLTQQEIDEAELLGKYLKDRDNKINTISIEKEEISNQRDNYKNELNKISNMSVDLKRINERVRLHFKEIVDLNYGQTFSNNNGETDTVYTFIVKWDTAVSELQSVTLNNDLKDFIKLEMDIINIPTKNLNVFQNNN